MWKTDIKIGEDTRHCSAIFAVYKIINVHYVFWWHKHNYHPNARHFRAPIILLKCDSKNNSINFDTTTETEHKTLFSFHIQHSVLNLVE